MDNNVHLGGQLDLAKDEEGGNNPQQKRFCGLLCESCNKSEAQVLELETNQVFCHTCHNRVKKEENSTMTKKLTQVKGVKGAAANGNGNCAGSSQVDYNVLMGSKANELMSTISCQNYLALEGEGQAAYFSKQNLESERRSNSSKQSCSSQAQYQQYDQRCHPQVQDPMAPPNMVFNSYVKMQQQQLLVSEGKGASYNDHQNENAANKSSRNQQQENFKQSSVLSSAKVLGSFHMHQQGSLLPPVTQYSQTCSAVRNRDGTYTWLEMNTSSDRSCDTNMSGQLSVEGRSSPMSIMNGLDKKIQSKRARDASLHRKGALARYKKKKENRKFTKKIRYESRKERADKRVRIRGRFAKVHN
jgi:hypothetical protein